jgi:hypothetical protein
VGVQFGQLELIGSVRDKHPVEHMMLRHCGTFLVKKKNV